jgi:hypothetical protein
MCKYMPCARKALRVGVVSCALAAAGFLQASAHAGQFGSFHLKPGDVADIQAGPPYLNLRVCNDVASSGSIGVAIGDAEPRTIGPGECTDSPGDKIRIQNRAAGEVAGIYQPFFNTRGRR